MFGPLSLQLAISNQHPALCPPSLQLKMQHYIPAPKGGSQDDSTAQVGALHVRLCLRAPTGCSGQAAFGLHPTVIQLLSMGIAVSQAGAASAAEHHAIQASGLARFQSSATHPPNSRRRRWSGRRSRSCTRPR